MAEARLQDGGLRYAPHLGFRERAQPLFRESAGIDPVAHIRLAARLGFSGMMHPWALSYPDDEIVAFGEAADSSGIEGSCVVFATRDVIAKPLWGVSGSDARAAILAHIDAGCRMAHRLRSKTVALIATADTSRSFTQQQATMRSHLLAAGDRAEREGLVLVIETMRTLPDMLLRDMGELIDLVRQVGHPAVKIAFDTHHCAALNGVDTVSAFFRETFDDIGVLQLASFPEKTEPGTGEIDFVPILAEAMRRRFRPIVELEHMWSEPGLEGERTGFQRFLAVDAAARSASGRHPTTVEGVVARD